MPEDQTAPALVAELWFPDAPDLSAPEVLDALRAVSPQTESQGSSLTVTHSADGAAPLVSVVLAGSALGTAGKVLPEVGQTWAWPEAEAAVAGCRASVLVTEMMTADSTPQQRVGALTRVVAALVSATVPAVVSWPQSQRVSDPEAFLADDVDGLINVRLFTVAGDAGARVMDTLGLHVFGIPDVQCHFRDREPGEVAALLFATGVYLFEAGDVIEDGNTISGPDGEGRYVCRRETALLDPVRPVLDVDLGEPYAAGDRDRG